MKTITIILIVLFAGVSIFFGVLLIKNMTGGKDAATAETIVSPVITSETVPEDTALSETVEETTEETYAPTDENIREIEIYLDGDRESGIFLGNTGYGLPSDDISLIYGEDFANFGFYLKSENKDYVFDPGSLHILNIYTFIPAHDWELTKVEVTVPGEPVMSETIHMSIDSIGENEVITAEKLKEVRISGWAADLSVSDSTGINRIEVYLDGPAGFGQKLGDAQYGLERADVGNAYGNANYNNSGYNFSFDASNLETGSTHKIYVYAFSNAGNYQYLTRDIIIDTPDTEEKYALVGADTAFSPGAIEITGWAFNKNFITQGVPRSLDIEYTTKKIVFVSNKSGNEDIWSMNLDGSELTQLTDNPDRDQYPAVSPDGKKIAYSSGIGGNWQIAVMNSDGTNKKQITFGPYRHGYPTWSFDGRFIICEIYIEENWEIYVMESDGSNIRRLTSNPGIDDWHPSAHPFNYTFLYEKSLVGNEEIWQMDLNGQSNSIVSKPGMRYRVPKYSIDGEKIVFMGYDQNGLAQIYTMDKNSENIVQLTKYPEGAGIPCYSPDNKLIVYNARINNNVEIFLMNSDGSDQRQLTGFPGDDWGAVFMYQAEN
jgi:TolB protein